MKLYDEANTGAVLRARQLRREATDAEKLLWRALRSKSVQRAGFAGGVEADNTAEPAKYELPTTDYDECLACQ
jgi:hypothetical protein